MDNFYISCQNSKIENNKSFYGSFCLGSFDPSLSITIANSLRRVLLSDINGLGIVSVQIEGVSHEYSNLDGVHEPILDILLNLKELILKKTTHNFRPQIAYLNARGPGIVRASNIIFPPSIQCVDPDQYIATLGDNGFLNMKIYINYGNKWLMSSNKVLKPTEKELSESKLQNINNSISKIKDTIDFNFEKRSFIVKKLIQLGFISSHSYQDNLLKKGTDLLKIAKKLKKNKVQKLSVKLANPDKNINLSSRLTQKLYPGILLKQFRFKDNLSLTRINSNRSKRKKTNSNYFLIEPNSLVIDSIFNPINKVNYIIEINDSKTSLKLNEMGSEAFDFYNIIKSLNSFQTRTELFEENFLKISDFSDSSISPLHQTGGETKEVSEKLDQKNASPLLHAETYKDQLTELFELKRDVNILKKEALKHNIILEIWTNGSIHPRDALYQAFKKLIRTFAQLHKINPFVNSNFTNKSPDLTVESINKKNYLLKQIKISKLSYLFNQNLIPLNPKYFIGTYLDPNIKNFYLKNNYLDPCFNDNKVLHNKTKINFLESNSIKTTNLNNENIIDPSLLMDKNTLKNSTSFVLKYQNMEISYLKLSLPTFTFLKRLNISTIGQLINFIQEQNKDNSINTHYNQLNKTSIKEIKKVLLNLGYSPF